MESLRCPLTLTLDRQLDRHAAGVPLGVLHHGPSHAGVVAGVLRGHLLHHQLIPPGTEEGAGLHLRPVEEPGVGEVRARCHAAAQREARALVGDGGEGFRGHPGVLRRSWGKKLSHSVGSPNTHFFFFFVAHSLTTLSWRLLLRPLPPAGADAAAVQWYDPSVEAVTFRENATDWFLSDAVPPSTTSSPSFTSSKVTGGAASGATHRKVTRELRKAMPGPVSTA